MPRKSAKSITINPNVRCDKIYPMSDTKKTMSELKTIGIRLSREQAINLARVLLAVSQDWDYLEITGRRHEKRKTDGTYPLTITSQIIEKK